MTFDEALRIVRDPNADPFDRYDARKLLSEPEPKPKPERLDTTTIDWSVEIDRRLREERNYILGSVTEAMAAVGRLAQSIERAREDDRRQRVDEIRQLRTELCEKEAKAQTTIAELFRLIATLGGASRDLPRLPAGRELN